MGTTRLVAVTIGIEVISWVTMANPSTFTNPMTARRTGVMIRLVVRLLIRLRLLLSVKSISMIKLL